WVPSARRCRSKSVKKGLVTTSSLRAALSTRAGYECNVTGRSLYAQVAGEVLRRSHTQVRSPIGRPLRRQAFERALDRIGVGRYRAHDGGGDAVRHVRREALAAFFN